MPDSASADADVFSTSCFRIGIAAANSAAESMLATIGAVAIPVTVAEFAALCHARVAGPATTALPLANPSVLIALKFPLPIGGVAISCVM
jgi:hypothetical protein